MSPDPSVHEDQLAELERMRRYGSSPDRRGMGCVGRLLVLCAVALLAAAGAIFWRAHARRTSAADEAREAARKVVAQGRRLAESSPEAIAADLRRQVEALKGKWKNHDRELDDLRQRADALRVAIAEEKKRTEASVRAQYDELHQRAEQLAQRARAKSEEVPAEFDRLLRTLRLLAGGSVQATPAPTPFPTEKQP